MATLAQIQQFFSVLLLVHWDKIGIERVKVMKGKVAEVAESLGDFVGCDAKFVLQHNQQLMRGVDYNPHPWRMKPFHSADRQFHNLVFQFLAELQAAFSHELLNKIGLQRLIDQPKLASYVLTQFFLNGSQLLDVDPKAIVYWRTIELVHWEEMINSPWLWALRLGHNAKQLALLEVYQQLEDERHVPVSLQLAKVSLTDLGFAGCATCDDAENRVRDLGYFPCPAHLGPQLRNEYEDQPDTETLNVLPDTIDPLWIGPKNEKRLRAYQLIHKDGQGILEVQDSGPSKVYPPETRLVICLNDPQPKEEDLGMLGNHEQLVARRHQAWLDAGGDPARAREESLKYEAAVAADPKSVERRTFDMSKDRLGLGGGAGSPNRPKGS